MARLRAAGCVFAEDEARLLTAEAPDPAALEALVARRERGDPLEQVLGWAEFCGLRVHVEPGVFVPRRRTEFLVRCAAVGARADPVLLDLCCGTGAIALALAHRLPRAEVHAADSDPTAVACARTNLAGRGSVHEGDLFGALPDSLRGRFDLVVVNAPYVPSGAVALMPPEARDHEPLAALDGGPDGLDVQRRVAAEAGEWLAPGGRLLIETGAAQADGTRAALRAAGFAVRIRHAAELAATVALARRPAPDRAPR